MKNEIKRVTTKELKNYNVDKDCPLFPTDLRKSYDLEIKNMGEYWTVIGRKDTSLIDPKKRAAYNKEWRKNNPGKTKEYYLNKKKKGLTGYDPDYYAANVEEFKERQYKSNEKHKEKRKAYLKEYYQKNREKMLNYMKDYNEQKKIEKGL